MEHRSPSPPGKPTGLTLGHHPALTMAATVPGEDEWRLCSPERKETNPASPLEGLPAVWAEEGPPGPAQSHAPIAVGLRPGATPVAQRQRPPPWEACLGIRDHIRPRRDTGILAEHRSPWNTLPRPVRKPGGNNHRPVRGLRAISSAVVAIHPAVPNPCTLLSLLPAHTSWFTCPDLRDAFFCLR